MSVATITDLWRMSATELAGAIRSKQVSSRDVVEAHLRRIEEVNASINAVTVVLAERALDAAKAADRITTEGGELPRFHGVPVTIKENIDLVGTPTTQGTKSLAQAYPTWTHPMSSAFVSRGLVQANRRPPGEQAPATGGARSNCYGASGPQSARLTPAGFVSWQGGLRAVGLPYLEGAPVASPGSGDPPRTRSRMLE